MKRNRTRPNICPASDWAPSSAEGSESVEVRLEGASVLADFSVGRYDIDIGRGARAAYIRFADKFQVW